MKTATATGSSALWSEITYTKKLQSSLIYSGRVILFLKIYMQWARGCHNLSMAFYNEPCNIYVVQSYHIYQAHHLGRFKLGCLLLSKKRCLLHSHVSCMFLINYSCILPCSNWHVMNAHVWDAIELPRTACSYRRGTVSPESGQV